MTMVVLSAVPLSATPTASAATTQVDQCAKPLGERVGGWACSDPVVKTDTQRKVDLQRLASTGAISDTQAAAAGFCRPHGCWTPVSAFETLFTGGGPYGFGKTALGTVHLSFVVKVRGFQTESRPFSAYTTRGTRNTVLVAERLYISPARPGGNSVNGGATRRTSPCGARNGSQSCLWGGNFRLGYASFENTAREISIVHEVTWTDRSTAFPGRWVFYGKSITMRKTGSGYASTRTGLPGLPVRGSWSPS
jgi:hypothetical protein